MGWSLDSWGGANTRVAQASQFLSTGIVGTAFGGTGCTSSSQCASGYKCSGGRCVQATTSGGSGGSGGVGNNTGGSYVPCDGGPDGAPSGGGPGSGGCSSPTPIGGGGGGGCTTSTCGQGSSGYGQDSDCCGDRCCRYFATGIPFEPINVNCYCGNCPGTNGSRCGDGYPPCGPGLACINGYCTEVKPCNKFCSEYYEANGEDAAGCSQDYRCDECTECTGEFGNGGGNYCDSKANLPCHCNGADLAECDICNSDGSVSPGVCLECCTIQNYDCGCGVAVTARVCRDRDASGPSQCNLAQDAAAQKCAEECGGPGKLHPCAGICEGRIQNGTGPCPDPNDPIDCPDGSNCNWTGCIEANGNHSILYNQCDMTNVPEECKACDCNCHNDCPPCQLCGADGTCYQDPSPECACGGAPKCGNACCQEGETCIESEPGNEATRTCCDGEPVAIYRSVWYVGGSQGTSIYTTVGPPEVALSNSCITCNGNGAICGTYCARPRMVIKNFYTGSGACTGGFPITVSFYDSVAPTCCSVNPGWNPVSFPTMVSQEITSIACCPKS